jgi:hypothetical protein
MKEGNPNGTKHLLNRAKLLRMLSKQKYREKRSTWRQFPKQRLLPVNHNTKIQLMNLTYRTLFINLYKLYNSNKEMYMTQVTTLLQNPALYPLGLIRCPGWVDLRIYQIRELLSKARKGPHALPKRRYIPKPGTTETRPLTIPPLSLRIRHKLLNMLLHPYILDTSEAQHAFIPHRGLKTCWQQLVNLLPYYPHAIEFDIRKFYDNISQERTREMLIAHHFPESLIDELLDTTFLNTYKGPLPAEILPLGEEVAFQAVTGKELIVGKGKGIQTGSSTTQFHTEVTFVDSQANGILQGSPASPWLSAKCLEYHGIYASPYYKYIGYADDGIILCDLMFTAQDELKRKLKLLNLELKPASVQPIKTAGHLLTFTFLGLKHLPDGTFKINSRSGRFNDTVITLDTLSQVYPQTPSQPYDPQVPTKHLIQVLPKKINPTKILNRYLQVIGS